ncbi:hypothetical protein PoB_003805700 [Plakobranchus ocellatus]|uniref:Uncharacterized protein n=1 Tax=Plakobranchus ocellatus TaxID=259542 RepID=A0AAV4AXB3_9GAST|nr:hypothetical protein PoB_003805700 [Plakobranchus ocellatus]
MAVDGSGWVGGLSDTVVGWPSGQCCMHRRETKIDFSRSYISDFGDQLYSKTWTIANLPGIFRDLSVASLSPGALALQRDLNNWIQICFMHDNVGDEKLANSYRNQERKRHHSTGFSSKMMVTQLPPKTADDEKDHKDDYDVDDDDDCGKDGRVITSTALFLTCFIF